MPDGFDVDSLDGQVAILLGAGAALPTHLADVPITVRQVTAGYRNVIKMRYANSSADLDRNLRLCDQLDRQAGDLDADPYGPLKLQELRDGWVQDRKDRRYCNRLTNAVRRIFKWAVSQELIEESTWRRLLAVEPLRAGQTDAPDNEPVQPVDIAVVRATAEFLSPVVRAMVRVQVATGMRPSEVCGIRPADSGSQTRSRIRWISIVRGNE